MRCKHRRALLLLVVRHIPETGGTGADRVSEDPRAKRYEVLCAENSAYIVNLHCTRFTEKVKGVVEKMLSIKTIIQKTKA